MAENVIEIDQSNFDSTVKGQPQAGCGLLGGVVRARAG